MTSCEKSGQKYCDFSSMGADSVANFPRRKFAMSMSEVLPSTGTNAVADSLPVNL